MHISEGVLSAPVLAAGAGMAVIGLAIGLKKMNQEEITLAGVMAAAFFLASLIHVPVGFGSAHLLLIGLIGVILGWVAFPAIFVALALQGLLFQYGGITTIGVNLASMGYAAVFSWYVFRWLRTLIPTPAGCKIAGFIAGFFGVAFASFLAAVALAFTSEGFLAAAVALFLAHLPIMIVEGIVTMLTVAFLARMRPELLGISNNQNQVQTS